MKEIVKYFIISIFISIIAIFSLKLMDNDIFKIVNINVTGEYSYIKTDIVDKIEKYKGESIFYIDIDKLTDSILSDIRVENVYITKRYPSDLDIHIEQKKLIGIFEENNEKYLVDDELIKIMSLKENIKFDGLKQYPFLVFNDESKKELISIISSLKNSELFSDIVEILKYDNIWILILDNNIIVKTNPIVDYTKYNFAKQLKDKEMIFDYIDLRFEDIVIK